MTLSPGTKLGPYEVLSAIGAGGMGEVYRAKDTRLDRTVAIKVLPSHLSADPERKQRFEREARTISSLNHPHICTLHDIGHQDGIDYLVMEYVEGESLAHRLEKGSLSTELVLRYGIQIAEALDKAHRQSIIHRDLKPGNIMLTKSGAKLLDFGLAKLSEARPAGPRPGLEQTQMETRQDPLTGEGVVMGTMQYMAPEQLEGKEVDSRTDIFALGTVLYEMATGKRAFTGKSQASLISAILKDEPAPISQIQPMTPPALDRVVKKCLAKDADERWQSAHDLADELRWIAEENAGTATVGLGTVVARPRRLERIAWTAGMLLLAAAAAGLLLQNSSLRQDRAAARPVRLQILAPANTALLRLQAGGGVAVSPDGRSVAFITGLDEANTRAVFVRDLDSMTSRAISGTEGAYELFWSYDSRFLGFFSFDGNSNKLKTVPAAGGPITTLCDVPRWGNGGTWNHDGVILYGDSQSSIMRIAATGGTPNPVARLDPARKEMGHGFPRFLPDGKHFIYVANPWARDPASVSVFAASLGGVAHQTLLTGAASVAYASGHLLFVREGTLLAQPFDVDRLQLTGEPTPIIENMDDPPTNLHRPFSVSENGILAYQEGESRAGYQLLWFDRAGRQVASIPDSLDAYTPQISPDGRHVVATIVDAKTIKYDIWGFDLARGTRQRLTSDSADDSDPIFSPDGSSIAFMSSTFESSKSGNVKLNRMASDGTHQEELLSTGGYPCSWSFDGKNIAFGRKGPGAEYDMWILPLFGDKKPYLFLQTQFWDGEAAFSPDGHWIAYSSIESGRSEIYVTRFPGPEGKWQISSAGGSWPRWRGDGKEIFCLSGDAKSLMAVDVQLGQTLEAGLPHALFPVHVSGEDLAFDASADGQRFLVRALPSGATPESTITVVLNWDALLKR